MATRNGLHNVYSLWHCACSAVGTGVIGTQAGCFARSLNRFESDLLHLSCKLCFAMRMMIGIEFELSERQ